MRPSWRLSLFIGLGFAALTVANVFPDGALHWVLAGGFALLAAYHLLDSRRRYRRQRAAVLKPRSPNKAAPGREPVR